MTAVFSSAEGRVALTVLGYQFPDLTSTAWDSDWLNIQLAAGSSAGTWSAVDPCLLTFELQSLISWLESPPHGAASQKRLFFTEPCLSFAWVGREAPATALRIFLSHEFQPPGIKGLPKEFFLDLSVGAAELQEATDDLRRQLLAFPVRVGRGGAA